MNVPISPLNGNLFRAFLSQTVEYYVAIFFEALAPRTTSPQFNVVTGCDRYAARNPPTSPPLWPEPSPGAAPVSPRPPGFPSHLLSPTHSFFCLGHARPNLHLHAGPVISTLVSRRRRSRKAAAAEKCKTIDEPSTELSTSPDQSGKGH